MNWRKADKGGVGMAADYYIHIADESLLGEDFKDFDEVLKYFNYNLIGSKYYAPNLPYEDPNFEEKRERAWRIVGNTPRIFIGEVSWLTERVPPTIREIDNLFGEDELVLIDDKFIEKVRIAFDLPNPTNYTLADPEVVVRMLKSHKGKYAFPVSW